MKPIYHDLEITTVFFPFVICEGRLLLANLASTYGVPKDLNTTLIS